MTYIAKYISALLSVILCFIVFYPAMIKQNSEQKQVNITEQTERLEQLREAYKNGNYSGIDENRFCDFNLDAAYAEGVKFNEVAFIGTHNSYQKECVSARQRLFDSVSTVTFGLVNAEKSRFSSDYLTDQLNLGIRSIELDIETVVKDDTVSFVCTHEPVFDTTSHCYALELALEELKLWSDANPNHLPVTVIIEPKKAFIPEENMRYFTCEYANLLGELAEEIFGEALLTPADMLRDHNSFGEMRAADDWLTLDETKGKIMLLLHETSVTEDYIKQDSSVKSQVMFPMLRYGDADRDCASFLIINKARDIKEQAAEVLGKNLIIRTRSDNFGSYKEESSAIALASGAQIVSTDYPPKTDMTDVERVVTFDGGCTVHLVKK